MKVNYQIMNEVNKNSIGRYVPNYVGLIQNASCDEEVEYIKEIEKRVDYRGNPVDFAFRMVYIVKNSCGHFEMFQTSEIEYSDLQNILAEIEKEADERKCSSCISGKNYFLGR